MAIENLERVIIANDTQANVEALVGALAEIVWARNTATGAIGYSIDKGVTWVWPPAPIVIGKYRQFVYAVSSGDFQLVKISTGDPVTVLLPLE